MSVQFSRAAFVTGTFSMLTLSTPLGVRVSIAQTLPKIVIASPASDDMTPALYAQRAGIFTKNGLDVDIQRMASGSAIASAIAGGSVQIGLINTLSIVIAHGHNIPFQVLAPGGLYTNDDVALLIVKKDAPFKTAKDLNGKIIGSPGVRDLNALATMAWIDQNGGDSSTTKVIELPATAIVPALDEGRIDMATVQIPALTSALESGRVRPFAKSWSAVAPRYQLSAWIVDADYAAKNADVARRFVQSIREASRYTNTHHAETLPLISAFSGVDSNTIGHGLRSAPPEFVDPANLQPVIDFALKSKLIDKRFDAKDIINPLALPPGK